MVRVISLLFVALALFVACSHECTTVGCKNGASVSILTVDGTWVDGAYSLEIDFDDDAYLCTFTTPDDSPDESGAWQALDCSPSLDAFLAPVVACESHDIGMSSSQTCGPVAGQFYVQTKAAGTPKALHVLLTRDDETVLDDSRTLGYASVQPNGPDCDPTCQQASVQLVVP
ncbi:MAG TPA: hypothetical protein VGQ57_04300 [Polyangiaceae bacterium]|jgi:hypothetical protein|nr:hypothetical protein [Polyangiaceae bacterium]